MDPITFAKLWMLVKPIKRIKERRAAKKAAREGTVVPDITEELVIKETVIVFDKLKDKVSSGATSATIGVAGIIVALGVFLQTRPEIIQAIVPDNYEGLTLSLVGVLVALARLRTLGK
jgi:hypothetical protein